MPRSTGASVRAPKQSTRSDTPRGDKAGGQAAGATPAPSAEAGAAEAGPLVKGGPAQPPVPEEQPPPATPAAEDADGQAAPAPTTASAPAGPGLGGVIEEISPRDAMLNPKRRQGYFDVGHSAIRSIRLGVQTAGAEEPRRILDMPSGHGRVLRWLQAEFPGASLAACDIDADAIDFCARTFGATPIQGKVDFDAIAVDEPYDLIWCGSLFTHIGPAAWTKLTAFLKSALVTDGVVVFSVHGRFVAERMRRGDSKYGLDDAGVRRAIESYDESGFGYADYPTEPGWGISLSTASHVVRHVERSSNLRLVGYTEHAWAHHDVVACARTPGG
jgi:SAM-dependent methyltransferase